MGVRRYLAPLWVVRPNLIPDQVAPRRFARASGASVLSAAAVALVFSAKILGWVGRTVARALWGSKGARASLGIATMVGLAQGVLQNSD